MQSINCHETTSRTVVSYKCLFNEIKNICTNMTMLRFQMNAQTTYLYRRIITAVFSVRKCTSNTTPSRLIS